MKGIMTLVVCSIITIGCGGLDIDSGCSDDSDCAGGQCCGFLFGKCVNTDSDPKNCGGCGFVCSADSSCYLGRCIPISSSNDACKYCEDDQHCDNEKCVCDDPALDICNGKCVDMSGPTCGCKPVDLQNDPENCGECGHSCLLGSACVAGECFPGEGWSSIDSGTSENLWDVWGQSADDVWIVGANGTILQWDGNALQEFENVSDKSIYGVWGSSSDDVWAVGDMGTIVHWNGVSWSPEESSTSNRLLDVWGSSPNDVWAVGLYGTIVHWNGGSWRSFDSGTSNSLTAVWGSASNDVWVSANNAQILHWNGNNWTVFDIEVEDWCKYHTSFFSVWGSDSNDVWIVGYDDRKDTHVTLRYDGNTWQIIYGEPDQFRLKGVWGSPTGEVWAVGSSDSIYRWDGQAWNGISGVEGGNGFQKVWGTYEEIFIVGLSGNILHYKP